LETITTARAMSTFSPPLFKTYENYPDKPKDMQTKRLCHSLQAEIKNNGTETVANNDGPTQTK